MDSKGSFTPGINEVPKERWYFEEYGKADGYDSPVIAVYEDKFARESDNYYADKQICEISEYAPDLQRRVARMIVAVPHVLATMRDVATRLRLRAEWYRKSDLAQRAFKAEADAGATILEEQIAAIEAALTTALGAKD